MSAGCSRRLSLRQELRRTVRVAALAAVAALGLTVASSGAAGGGLPLTGVVGDDLPLTRAAPGDPPTGAPAGGAPDRRGPGLPGLPLQFDSELIRLHIVADSLEVDGIYRFLCDARGIPEMSLFYPYPQDSLLGGARMLRLEARAPRGAWQPARFEEIPRASGGRWWVPLDLGDSLEVRCIYRQALRTTYARYIVTTTRHWQKPLARARFEIYLPQGVSPTRFSFPFQVTQEAGVRCYVYETEHFMPAEDIIVEWTADAQDGVSPGAPSPAPAVPETSPPRDR